MKYILFLFSILFLIGCGENPHSPIRNDVESPLRIEFPTSELDIKVYPSIGARKARVFLAHGFGGDRMVYENAPFSGWRLDMQLKGYEVVTYNQPAWDFKYFSTDSGLAWRNAFDQFLVYMVNKVNAEHGVIPNISGGVSFGGLHAMMAMELHPELFDAWFGAVPVTDYTALVELQNGSSTHFNPFLELNILRSKPGFLHYGEQDERVNFRLTIDLINQIELAPNQLTWMSLGQTGHASTEENLGYITDWLETLY